MYYPASSSSFLTQSNSLSSLAKSANNFSDLLMTRSLCHLLATKSMEVQMWPIPFQTVWSLSAERCVVLRLSRARTGGGGPLLPCPLSNACRGGHKTCYHSSPSPQETPWQLEGKEIGPSSPFHACPRIHGETSEVSYFCSLAQR